MSMFNPATNDLLTADERTLLGRVHALSENQRLSLLESIFLAAHDSPYYTAQQAIDAGLAAMVIMGVK